MTFGLYSSFAGLNGLRLASSARKSLFPFLRFESSTHLVWSKDATQAEDVEVCIEPTQCP